MYHPRQPGTKLTHAAMHVPTLRGIISLSFSREKGVFTLQLTLPGNTLAEVCLPAALLGAVPELRVNGEAVDARRPADRPGQVCVPHDVGGGEWAVTGR